MASKKANEYTDKKRPSGYYMIGGKRRFWSAENKKWYLDQLGSTDDTLDRMGIPNPAGVIKRIVKGDPEKVRRNNIQLQIEQRGGRGMQLPSDYKETEQMAEVSGRRAAGQVSNIPLNENEVPEIKRNRELKMLTDGERVQIGGDSAPQTDSNQTQPKKRLNVAETIKAGKDPLHVWAKANKAMIERNQNAKELKILREAEEADKRRKNKDKLGTTAAENRFIKPSIRRTLGID